MHIAIIGTGFSGLATGWFLLKHGPQLNLTFYDSLGLGGGASGIAAGLMHPYSGASAKLNRQGLEGYALTLQLLKIASLKLGKPVFNQQGLLRLAISDKQQQDFFLASKRYKDILWCNTEETQQRVSGLSDYPGIFIRESITVDCPLYMEGLWQACKEKGSILEKTCVQSIDDLKHFDHIVLANGSSVNQLIHPYILPLTYVKGQILDVPWPKNLNPLQIALNSQAYILMNQDKGTCLIGATYEKGFESSLPNASYAVQDIMPKASALISQLKGAAILDCRAGVRVSTPDHLPIIQKVKANGWVITGMGSKGLLYHALYAEKLAQMILQDKSQG